MVAIMVIAKRNAKAPVIRERTGPHPIRDTPTHVQTVEQYTADLLEWWLP